MHTSSPARHLSRQMLASALVLALTLSGCAQNAIAPAPTTPPKTQVQFLDISSFDRDLAQSMSAPLPKVEVAFLDVVKPSAMPERLQKWMASVEASGGKVVVTPPKSDVQSKSLIALVGVITTLWTASKTVADAARESRFKAASAYNAEVVLKRDASGDNIVDRVVFTQR